MTEPPAEEAPEEQRTPGDMHEPKPYTGDLDWDDQRPETD